MALLAGATAAATAGVTAGVIAPAALAPAALAEVAPAQTAPPDAYVALGDSFTAAPLVPEPTGEPRDCGRSTRNYPHLVAEAIGAEVFRDVSCGSARTEHFSEPQTGLPFGGTNPPQFDALGPDVALVTIGIGGNDIGFGEIVERCFQPPEPVGEPCVDHYTAGGRDELRDRIAATAPKIAAVITETQRRAPSAAVYVVGYPTVLPDQGDGCYPYVPVLAPDVHYLRGIHKALNAMLAEQAEAHGATYVDWYTPSIGHDACQPPSIAWVNGLVVVPPSFPVHPNQFGTAGGALAVLAALEATGFDLAAAASTGEGAEGGDDPAGGDTSGGSALPATGGNAGGWVALVLGLGMALARRVGRRPRAPGPRALERALGTGDPTESVTNG